MAPTKINASKIMSTAGIYKEVFDHPRSATIGSFGITVTGAITPKHTALPPA